LRSRARELVHMSESRWVELLEENSIYKINNGNTHLPRVYANSLEIFNALSEVVLHLGSDFMKLKQHFGLDDDQTREILSS